MSNNPPGSMFSTQIEIPEAKPALEFKFNPMGEVMGAELWQAHHGSFVFTIARHPDIDDGYSIGISFRDDYLPKGPANTLAEAVAICQRALHTLSL